MNNDPDRLYIDKKDRSRYDKLDEVDMLRFKGKGGGRTRREQFLFALSIGFQNNHRKKLEIREGFVLYKDLRPMDESLIDSIAIYDADKENVLSNKK